MILTFLSTVLYFSGHRQTEGQTTAATGNDPTLYAHMPLPVLRSYVLRVRRFRLPGPPVRELELIQPHMAQKPVLRGEVGCACVAREVSVERGGMGGVTKRAQLLGYPHSFKPGVIPRHAPL